jgi:protein involved in polysaccharide export with SLBB domain
MSAIAALALILSASNPAPVVQVSVAKIQVGDKLRVVVAEDELYNGEYTVLDDGSVTGVGFGRLVLAGKTVDEARVAIRNGLKSVFKTPTVSLVVLEQKKKFVFVTSLVGNAPGPIEFEPGFDIRRVITGITLPVQTDEVEVRLFRDGKEAGSDRLDHVLQGVGEFGGQKLKPNDVVTLVEIIKHRIYVGGEVKSPGEQRVPEGTDALQALALAGGTTLNATGEVSYKIQVRRGINVFDVSTDPIAPRFTLQPGDTVLVTTPQQIQVSVGGDVRSPGQWTVREGTDVLAAIQRAGGLSVEGTLQDVLVIRGSESYILDLISVRKGNNPEPFPVKDGDLVFVRRNEKRLIVLGFVKSPKTIRMEESREYKLADAVSEAGGPDARGTYHRVYVGRRDDTGKVQVTEYKLAAFLKDGDLTQNPTLMPGDLVMVGEVKGMTLAQASSVLSNALLLDRLFGG